MMKGNLRWVALFLPFLALVHAEDRRQDKSRLIIMTLNAEFLWDGVAPEEGQVSFPWKFSQSEAEDHMREVAEIIARADADIVNLVEVENIAALRTLNDRFLAGRGYRPYLVNGRDTFTGQDVALLTRVDPEGDAIQRDDRQGQSGNVRKSLSKNYLARIGACDSSIALIGIHLLAFPLREDRRLERQAQAAAVKEMAVERLRGGDSVVVLGDFNDYDGEASSRDHVESMPITTVLQSIRGMDPATPSDDLVNAASFVPKANRFTAHHDANDNGRVDPPNELTSIDHVLLSSELAGKVTLVEMPHHHDPIGHPDHFPVVVRLQCGTATPPPGGSVRITRLLPNPAGDEMQNEEATLKNTGGQPVSLTGWRLRDLSGRTWSLDPLGTLQPGQERTIRRNGQPMAMNNNGDTIDLLDPSGAVIQTVTYGRVDDEDEVIPAP